MTADGPRDSADLIRRAQDALRARNPDAALSLLKKAEAVTPRNTSVHLNKALAHRARGDFPAAFQALESVLALDPYHFLALLSKGSMLEQQGLRRRAATVYQNALTIAPSDDKLPRPLLESVTRARKLVAEQSDALRAHLEERLRDLRRHHAGANLERFDESLDILAGIRRAYVQQPVMLHYPRLPAIPFYDRAMFPWLAGLEAATPAIREELTEVLEVGTDDFEPYIAYPPGTPVNQWKELNHSRRWSSYFLWRDGIRQDEACERCPRTAALVDELPLARQPGFAPTVMFSALEPHTVIPPHTGSINTRLIVHLPLILPDGCRFRVGNVTRDWRMNEAWVFDDTIEHEAWNDSAELRILLIFDVWNPFLSEAERELLTAMLHAKNEFQALDGRSS